MNPIPLTVLDEQGNAERYDIVVDFSMFPARRPGLPRERAGDARRRARTEGGFVAGRRAGGRSGRSGHRQDHGIPGRKLGAERRRAGPDADHCQQLRPQRQEPGAGSADRADPGRRAGADEAGRVRPIGGRRLAGPCHRSMHPRLSGEHAVPVDHQGERRGRALLQRQPGLDGDPEARGRSSTGPMSTAAAAGTIPSICTSRKASL